jgi:hypothetical protein
MTAAWKQKKFERLAQKDLVEKLKGEIALLQDKITDHKHREKYMQEQITNLYQQRDEASVLANRYNALRTQELMIATPDGFKLVTGEELDIHCGALMYDTTPKVRWPATHMTYTVSADEALDSWQSTQQAEKFTEALRRSMLYGSSIVKMGIENGLNTGSTGKEEDTQNP